MNRNIKLLYGFSFFDQFMIVIPVGALARDGGDRHAAVHGAEAVFALVILSAKCLPRSRSWGRKKTLVGAMLKAASFSFLPLWSGFEGFLFYHLTMGIALSRILGGDVALLYDWISRRAARSRGTAVLGNAKLAAETGGGKRAGGGRDRPAVVRQLLWANAI